MANVNLRLRDYEIRELEHCSTYQYEIVHWTERKTCYVIAWLKADEDGDFDMISVGARLMESCAEDAYLAGWLYKAMVFLSEMRYMEQGKED